MPPYGPPDQPHFVKPRLWRSARDKKIAGVVGGLAERLDMQAGTARIFYVLLSVFSGAFPGIAVYLFLWIITGVHDVPPEPGSRRFFRR